MKIGFVLDDSLDKADGVQQYILTLGRYYTSIGHQVHYLVGETHRSDIPNVHSLSRNLNVKFNQNRMSIPFPANRNKIRTLLGRENFDVLHVQTPHSPMLGARIVKYAGLGTAVVGTFHILPYSRLQTLATRLLGVWLRRNLKRFDMLGGTSRPAAKFARKCFRINAIVMPNTIDTAAFSVGKKIKKYDDGKLNIVYLGRLVERKGCQHLLNALKLMHERHQLFNVRVLICGKGPLDAELKRFVKVNNLASTVHFTGFISESDKPDYLASAHIAVYPSTSGESFGIVLIEAMAAGSQVVLGGNNPGYRSVMGKHTDQLFNPSDQKAFAGILKHFLTNGRARLKAARWQAADVKQYDVNVVGRQLIQIYQSAVAKHNV